MAKPRLVVFAISHYCEKARWAIEHHEIDYELEFVAPGAHVSIAKKLGAPGSSVPILVADGGVVQGSSRIVDWADRVGADDSRRLGSAATSESREIEKRLDEIAGIHVRRYYYSEATVEHPDSVRRIFARHLPFHKKLLLRAIWGQIRKKMIYGLDLGPEQGSESLRVVAGELDWLDGLLADGRAFLVGDRFSRVDLTAASLLAPLALPKEASNLRASRDPASIEVSDRRMGRPQDDDLGSVPVRQPSLGS